MKLRMLMTQGVHLKHTVKLPRVKQEWKLKGAGRKERRMKVRQERKGLLDRYNTRKEGMTHREKGLVDRLNVRRRRT